MNMIIIENKYMLIHVNKVIIYNSEHDQQPP